MIDIETLGTKPGCVILSISAVWFDINSGETGEEFELYVDINDSVEIGLDIEEETFLWWMRQDVEARINVFGKDGHDLHNVLETFNQFFRKNQSELPSVWANSPSFDLVILSEAFEICELKKPWEYFQERDVRTLDSLSPKEKKETQFEGVKHNGIDDCKHQIKYCSKIFNKLNIASNPNT